jgi:Tfp pilus assembly protein PilO
MSLSLIIQVLNKVLDFTYKHIQAMSLIAMGFLIAVVAIRKVNGYYTDFSIWITCIAIMPSIIALISIPILAITIDLLNKYQSKTHK